MLKSVNLGRAAGMADSRRPNFFRDMAAKMFKLAENAPTESLRASHTILAEDWTRLAEHAECDRLPMAESKGWPAG
jgi:hypothetical protein